MALTEVAVPIALPPNADLTNETDSAPVTSRETSQLSTALRIGSHAVVWVLVLVPAGLQMSDGWLPTRDNAMISIGSYQVFSAKFPLVVPKAGHTRDALENLFHEHKLKPRYAMELDSSELLKRFVAADVGVGFIARSNVSEDVRAGVLSAIPLADAQIRRDLALVFRKDKALSRAALAFIDTTVKIKTVDPVVASKS